MNNTLLSEQYIINNILNNLHENINKDLYIKEIKEIIRDEILQEGIKEVLQSKKFWSAVAAATLFTMSANMTLGFVDKYTTKTGMVYSSGDLLQTSNNTDAFDAIKETENLYKGSVKINASTFKTVEDMALKADASEAEWNSIKNHPILRAIYIATIFKTGGKKGQGFTPNTIRYENKDDLMKKLSNLDVTDARYANKAWKMAQKQKKIHKKGNILYLSFSSAWCGGFAGFMLGKGHGIPSGAVNKLGNNQTYGNYMSKNAPRGMFTHQNKQVLDGNKLKYKRLLVPGAILQVGKKRNRWAGHFLTIMGIGFESSGRMFLMTAEGNTAPETGFQAASLGIQELIDAYTGIDKSGTKYKKDGKTVKETTKGSFWKSLKHVVGGHAGGAGRTVSGKKRYVDELEIMTITLPQYSQKIVSATKNFYKGLESEAKKLSAKEKVKRKSKKKVARKARRKNKKRQNSSYSPEGDILFEYTRSFLNNHTNIREKC